MPGEAAKMGVHPGRRKLAQASPDVKPQGGRVITSHRARVMQRQAGTRPVLATLVSPPRWPFFMGLQFAPTLLK